MRGENLKVNVGCGATPTAGFVNLDNSWSVRLAKVPVVGKALTWLPLLAESQRAFLARSRELGIDWADAGKLPFKDGAVALVYSSHMVEHLTRDEATSFLREVLRVLEPGGWLRIAVPDLRALAHRYVEGRLDANAFVEATLMTSDRPRGTLRKLAASFAGPRHHLWMYDGPSLCKLLSQAGFVEPTELPEGQTTIPDPGELNLSERSGESVYAEARKGR